MPFDKFRWFGVTYEEARAGCYNGAERLKDMDLDGIHAEILFPPQRTMSHFLGDDDEDFVLAGVEGTHRAEKEHGTAALFSARCRAARALDSGSARGRWGPFNGGPHAEGL